MARCRRSRVPATTTYVFNGVGCSVFLNNRYHDPTLGHFISVDPLVGKTGQPYLYGDGNPSTLSDPSGLCAADNGSGSREKCIENRPAEPPPLNSPELVEPMDPFDGTHTKSEVSAFLLDHYRYGENRLGYAYTVLVNNHAIDWALSTNVGGRAREDISRTEIALLYLRNLERRYNPKNPTLTSMDLLALDVLLPWADVQTATTCGGDSSSPIYCVGVTRLPSLDSDADAMMVGNFMLLDVTSGSRDIVLDSNGNWVATDNLAAHELTHKWRAHSSSRDDGLGIDDRSWYKNYPFEWEAEENCAYQVGSDNSYAADHVVSC